jgi:hypothetical protein
MESMSVTFGDKNCKLTFPDEWYKCACVYEWAKSGAGCEPEGLWGIHLPFGTSEERERVLSLGKGDTLELTSKNDRWTKTFRVEAFGADHQGHVRCIYVRQLPDPQMVEYGWKDDEIEEDIRKKQVDKNLSREDAIIEVFNEA